MGVTKHQIDSLHPNLWESTMSNNTSCSISRELEDLDIILNILALQTRGQTLGKLVGLFGISHHQRVQESRASDLELGLLIALADLYQLGIRTASLLQKIADIRNLLRHDE